MARVAADGRTRRDNDIMAEILGRDAELRRDRRPRAVPHEAGLAARALSRAVLRAPLALACDAVGAYAHGRRNEIS